MFCNEVQTSETTLLNSIITRKLAIECIHDVHAALICSEMSLNLSNSVVRNLSKMGKKSHFHGKMLNNSLNIRVTINMRPSLKLLNHTDYNKMLNGKF